MTPGISDEKMSTWQVALGFGRRRIANGGWEWFLMIGDRPIYHSDAAVGLFTGPEVRVDEAFQRVLVQWGIRREEPA